MGSIIIILFLLTALSCSYRKPTESKNTIRYLNSNNFIFILKITLNKMALLTVFKRFNYGYELKVKCIDLGLLSLGLNDLLLKKFSLIEIEIMSRKDRSK